MFSPYKNSSASSRPNGRQIMHSTERISDKMTGNFTKISMLRNGNGNNVNIAESPLAKLQCSNIELCNRAQFMSIQDEAATFLPPPLISTSASAGESVSFELQTNTAPKVKSFMSNDLESQQQHVRMLNEDGLQVLEASARHDQNSTSISRANDSELADEVVDISKGGGHMDMFRQEKKVCRGEASNNEEPKIMSVFTNDSVMRSESCHASIITDVEHQTLKVGNGGSHHLQVKDLSNASVKDCASRSMITSEAVINMIGQEEFQKARNAIIHQQRVFSMQVVELHRLIRVQKLSAGFGRVQHKECPPMDKELREPTFMKNSLLKSTSENPSWPYRSRNRVTTTKLAATDKPKPPSLQLSLSSDTTNSDNRHTHNKSPPPMWYFSPPGNQWLLPVMSPSEGLIYKPYPNPPIMPPLGGFLPTVYNEVGPTNNSAPREEFPQLATNYGINNGLTPSMGTTYFAPHERNILNPCPSSSAFKQMTSYNNLGVVQHSSCNSNNEANKDGEKKVEGTGDTLPLFPTAPSSTPNVEQPIKSRISDQKIQVIKVIPYNPKLASESAARIVESIQQERAKTLL